MPNVLDIGLHIGSRKLPCPTLLIGNRKSYPVTLKRKCKVSIIRPTPNDEQKCFVIIWCCRYDYGNLVLEGSHQKLKLFIKFIEFFLFRYYYYHLCISLRSSFFLFNEIYAVKVVVQVVKQTDEFHRDQLKTAPFTSLDQCYQIY